MARGRGSRTAGDMLARVVARSIAQRRGSFSLAVVAVAAAAALVTALLGVGFAIEERMAADLRGFGANVVVVPRSEPVDVTIGSLKYVAPGEEAYIDEAALPKLKTIFWRHNILAFVPWVSRTVALGDSPVLLAGTWFDHEVALPAPRRVAFGSAVRRAREPEPGRWRTGLRHLGASWTVAGRWPADGAGEAVIGRALARRLARGVGDRIDVRIEGRAASFPIVGVLESGGPEDDQLLVDLDRAQALLGLAGKIERVDVSALVTPDNALAERARRVGPERLPAAEYETWYCTPYLDSIVFQIEEALPGTRAKARREVAETEGRFLRAVTLTFALVTAIAVVACTLGVAVVLARAALERRREIGLMKALGAERRQIALLFLLEASIAGLVGGAVGAPLGMLLAGHIGREVFAMPITPHPVLLPAVLAVAVVIALVGAAGPLLHALRVVPVRTLTGP